MSRIRIHLDEDCQAHALAKALQQHGIDAKTTNELGLGGINDQRQLEATHQAGRVLVSNNISDFVPLHARWLADHSFRHNSLSSAGALNWRDRKEIDPADSYAPGGGHAQSAGVVKYLGSS